MDNFEFNYSTIKSILFFGSIAIYKYYFYKKKNLSNTKNDFDYTIRKFKIINNTNFNIRIIGGKGYDILPLSPTINIILHKYEGFGECLFEKLFIDLIDDYYIKKKSCILNIIRTIKDIDLVDNNNYLNITKSISKNNFITFYLK